MLGVLKNKHSVVYNIAKAKFPEKLKGTSIEKLAKYCKNLIMDYNQMLRDVRTDIQDDPRKALLWSTGIVIGYVLYLNNPDKMDFNDALKRIGNETALVSNECRNPRAAKHLQLLETSLNNRLVHYQSLGIASIMYLSEVNEECDLYQTQCQYLKPSYLSFLSRIIDVGFMGRWWNIFIKTNNYDVNVD